MKNAVLTSLGMLLVMTLVTGVAYPFLVTVISDLHMPGRAAGSLVSKEGRCVGSSLVGQRFAGEGFFRGRPSASDYGAMPSAASNAGPTSALLRQAIEGRRISFRQDNRLPDGAILPADMLFASGSGLDPHISPSAASCQVLRIAENRGIPATAVDSLVTAHIEPAQWGFLGQPRVNVLSLNIALDARCERK
jgi:potassium-transporting ATPase KdpC subunit